MTEINTIGLGKDTRAIIDALEEIAHDIREMAGSMNHMSRPYGTALKTLRCIADEIHWLAEDVAEICLNGASYMKTYQTMGAYDFKIECLYNVRDDVRPGYWRDEVDDNIEKLAGLYAQMLKAMEGAVIKHARGE